MCFVDALVGAAVLVALMAYYGIWPGGAIVYLPLVVLVHWSFTAGVGLALAMANLFFRDVKYLFEVVITVWMFVTSVIYPVSLVGGTLGTLLLFNPMTPIVDGYRRVLLFGQSPLEVSFLGAALVSVVTFLAAWLVFHRAEFRFAENI